MSASERKTRFIDNDLGYVRDPDVGARYMHVAQIGTDVFAPAQSALLKQFSWQDVGARDLPLIGNFHQKVSPVYPDIPWRLQAPFEKGKQQEWADESIRKGLIADPSYYANWDMPGGPAEHIEVATDSALLLTYWIQQSLRPQHQIAAPWDVPVARNLRYANPYHIAAATGFHDDGRLVTHLFSNGPIGRRLLQRIGIRDDIISIIPDEDVYFQVPLEESMDEAVQAMDPSMVLVALADNFGKRFPGSNRLYRPDDFTPEKMKSWADGYANRPLSGRPSDAHTRRGLQLHTANEKRVFDALGNWVQAVTDTNLYELTAELNRVLAPRLPRI